MLSLLKNHKKILQLLPSFAEHDAVSNQVVAMNQVLEASGFKTQIYSNHFPKKYKGIIGEPKFLNENKFDLAIYHHSIGDPIAELVKTLNIPVILVYHNITPPEYFEVYNQRVYELLMQGKKQLAELSFKPVHSFAASEFNKKELDELGYKNTDVLPIFFDSKNLSSIKEDQRTKELLDPENITNVLFVGRFVPNKSHKDLIKAFYIYHKYFNSMSRLNLVGSYVEMDSYLREINELVQALELESVVHTPGQVNESEWVTYYKNSNVFLSLSEHEGFFVPALESNLFDLPIIAFNAGAVASTVGDAGLIIDNKEPGLVAEMIHRVVSDHSLRKDMIEKGRENIKRYELGTLGGKLVEVIEKYV